MEHTAAAAAAALNAWRRGKEIHLSKALNFFIIFLDFNAFTRLLVAFNWITRDTDRKAISKCDKNFHA